MKNLYKIKDELYIVSSSEKIKENTQSFKQGLNGDWFYNTIYNFIARTGDITSYDFKIILTTNKLLIKDGVQAIDDEFLEWFVKNPSCGEVDVINNYHMFSNKNSITNYEIIIPKEELHSMDDEVECNMCGNIMSLLEDESNYACFNSECTRCYEPYEEEPKQETLEEAAEKYAKQFDYAEDSSPQLDFIEGAKWQSEKMYSEEEVIAFAQWMYDYKGDINKVEELLKQFKKK